MCRHKSYLVCRLSDLFVHLWTYIKYADNPAVWMIVQQRRRINYILKHHTFYFPYYLSSYGGVGHLCHNILYTRSWNYKRTDAQVYCVQCFVFVFNSTQLWPRVPIHFVEIDHHIWYMNSCKEQSGYTFCFQQLIFLRGKWLKYWLHSFA